jgi:hypothetical protein
VLIDERGMTEEAGRIDEVVLIEGAARRDEWGPLAEEKTESAAAARTAVTSCFAKIIGQDSPASSRLTILTERLVSALFGTPVS